MQIPIISGIYTDESSDFRTAYPRNMIPVPKAQGISSGYLRPADGIVAYAGTGPGPTRGGINWQGRCYRVMGDKLVHVAADGVVSEIGTVADDGGEVSFDYSFDRLSLTSGGSLYYYDGSTFSQVTDPDLGIAIDHVWVDGYFMTTDGEFLIVTELTDPFSILPTRYGSSEADPDPVKALLKVRNEPYAINRYTTEVFDNVGGTGFPFQRIEGAQIQKGAVGTHACCLFLDSVAMVGGGRNESAAVWLASSGSAAKISTREIEQVIAKYSEEQLSRILVEARVDKGHQLLHIHLPGETAVYDAAASQALGSPVWFTLSTGLGVNRYEGKNLVYCYGRWLVGSPLSPQVGYLSDEVSEHWGKLTEWEFGTSIVYNDGMGAIFHEVELVCLSGRANLGADPKIMTQYSLDGETWSMPKYISAGRIGQRNKRLSWLNQGSMRHWRIQRFIGTSDAHLSVARLEARLEPLAV